MAHLLLTPVLNVAMKAVVDSAGAVLWYTGAGVWWLGKRAIYGYQPSAEEIQAQREREREQEREAREQERELKLEKEREEQRKERELLEKLLQQQSEMLNQLGSSFIHNQPSSTSESKST